MGIHPALGVGIIAIASILIAIFLMQKTVYAHYIIGFLGLSVVASLNEKKRNDFLNLCFSKTKFLKIRLIENLLLISPFVIFLIFTEEYLIAGITLLLSEFFVFTHFNKKWSFHIPSPFSKYPFERKVHLKVFPGSLNANQQHKHCHSHVLLLSSKQVQFLFGHKHQ